MESNQGYNPYKWVICPLTRLISLHIPVTKYPEPLSTHLCLDFGGGIKVPSSFIGVLRSPNSYIYICVESQHHTAAEQEKRTIDLETKSLTSPIESKVCGCVCFFVHNQLLKHVVVTIPLVSSDYDSTRGLALKKLGNPALDLQFLAQGVQCISMPWKLGWCLAKRPLCQIFGEYHSRQSDMTKAEKHKARLYKWKMTAVKVLQKSSFWMRRSEISSQPQPGSGTASSLTWPVWRSSRTPSLRSCVGFCSATSQRRRTPGLQIPTSII